MTLFPRSSPEAVVREHGPQVHRDLRRIFGPRADVDDVFQNVFVEVLRSLPSFAGRSRLAAWIRRITWNVAYQEMRVAYRRPPQEELEAAHELAQGRSLEQELETREALVRLYSGLEALDPKLRLVVVLHDVEGNTLKEIAEALGRPLQTIASQLHAGRARLVERMREMERPRASAAGRDEERRRS